MMLKFLAAFFLVAFFICVPSVGRRASIACSPCYAADTKGKKAVLVVSFGTSVKSARADIDNLVSAAAKNFPDCEIRQAFTSNMIRRKLIFAGEKNVPPSVPMALAQLNDEEFTDVYVSVTHIVRGAEYDEVKNVVDAWHTLRGKYAIKNLRLTFPFLSSQTDCTSAAEFLMKRFDFVPPDTAVVLMGHGSPVSEANEMYIILQNECDKLRSGRFFIATAENSQSITDVAAVMKKSGYKKVLLSPLMIVAGDHANNDLAGVGEKSWLNILKKDGFIVETYLHGLGSDENFAELFVQRIKEMMK